MDRGGMKVNMEFILDHQYVDGERVPLPKVKKSYTEFDHNKISLDITSGDLGPQIVGFFLNGFKAPFIAVLQPVLNVGAFPLIVNGVILDIINNSRHQVDSTMIQMFTQLLPANNIQIPGDMKVSYSMPEGQNAVVDGGRIYGYFTGDISNMGDRTIRDEKYTREGDMDINQVHEPAAYQISTKLLNNMFEVVLGSGTIEIDISYQQMQDNHFPIDWTSTQLEGAVDGICDAIGYDIPLSARFINEGAPRFVLTKDDLSVRYNMLVEVYDENFNEKYLDMHFKDVFVKFDMNLNDDFLLQVDWNDIEMDKATIDSHVDLRHPHIDEVHVMKFFNWIFELILPWVNEYHPENISRFHLPRDFPGIVHVNSVRMSIEDEYLSFGMDPVFKF